MSHRTSQETFALFDKYVIPNYRRNPVCLVKGEGSRVWDADGNCYLDLFPGWGCNVLGYSPKRVVQAVQEQVAKLIHVPNSWYTEPQGELAEAICTRGFGKAFFSNSGAEANEGAIKLARLSTPAGKYKLITFENGFHGRTYAAISATAQPKYQEGFGPLVPGFMYAPFNDLEAVRRLIDDETCAIMIEPVQGEGGVNTPAPGFLQGLRDICDEHGLRLVFDEVQTGMGRTGNWFAYQTFGVQPDIMTMAKGIAAGVACGAIIASEEVAPALRPGLHASTFGGNPIAMVAGLATVRTIEEEGILDNVRRMSEKFRIHFETLKQELPIIEEVRVCGMMIGIELSIESGPAVKKCLQRGLMVNSTHDTVVRLLPALNLTEADFQEGCAILTDVLREMANEAAG